MGLQQMLLEGALAAAELLAWSFVSPVSAHEAVPTGAGSALEWRVQLDAPLADEAIEAPSEGHVRLSVDEQLADAFHRSRGSTTAVETVVPLPLECAPPGRRAGQPASPGRDAARVLLFDEADGAFLLLLPHRAATHARLVLRPAAGPAETRDLGAVDTRHALLIPLAPGTDLDHLAAGAIELELSEGRTQWWSTIVPRRPDRRGVAEARTSALEQ